ncbi:MAG: diguanylate cyclase [Cognaticolwellia sp.]
MKIKLNEAIILKIIKANFFVFFILYCSTICIQSYAADENVEQEKTPIEQLDELEIKDPAQALKLAKKLLIERESAFSANDKITIFTRIAQYSSYIGDDEQSLQFIERAYSLKPNLNSDAGIILLITHANASMYNNQNSQAMTLYQQAENNAKITANNSKLAEVYGAMAEYYSFNYDDINAFKYFRKSFLLLEKLGNELALMLLKSKMANAYSNIHDDEKAIALGTEVLAYFNKHELYYDATYAQFMLAYSYLRIENYVQAQIAFEKVIELAKLTDNEVALPAVYLGLAQVFFHSKQYDKSRDYLQIFHKTRQPITLPHSKIDYLLLEAELELLNENTESALQRINEIEAVLASLEESTTHSWQLDTLLVKAKISFIEKDYRSAYLFEKEASKLYKSYQNTQRETIRSKHKVILDTEQAQFKNTILERDKLLDKAALKNAKQQQWMQYLVILFSLTFVFFLALLVRKQFKASKRLNILANTDSLTGLANRRFAFEYAELQLVQNKKDNHPFSLIVFDIDFFKAVNDTYGHAGGDLALVSITKVASKYVRDQDILGRVGGEEFLLALPNTSASKAFTVAQRIREGIEMEDIEINNINVNITASFGVAELSSERDSLNQIFKDADEALYQAKEHGRNLVKIAK